MIQVFKPSLGEEELDALREIFATGWIGLGPKTAEFEEKFAEYVGAKYAIATNSATAALHLCCIALDLDEWDVVMIPTMTFVSTAHAPTYCGAFPLFVDIETDTLNIQIKDLAHRLRIAAKLGHPRIKAIIPVHYGGHACQMDAIWNIADKYGLRVIEDAAHACGSEYKGQKIGGLERSWATCFSFHAVKNLPCGDGGMITTNHLELVERFRRLRWCGIDKSTWDRTEEAEYKKYSWYYEVNELGYKYHMNDIAAVIGLCQLEKLDKGNARRRDIANAYTAAFQEKAPWIETPVEKSYAKSSWHNYVIKTSSRDALNAFLKEKGIATGVHYYPIHLQPYYRRKLGSVVLPVAERVWPKLLTLPMYPSLTDEEISYIIYSILEFGRANVSW